MAKKRLNIKDKTGLPVDYDISAENVTIDGAGGKPLTQKLDEITETEAQAVRSITFNGQSYSRNNGIINIGEQEQPNWNESNPNYRTYIRNKPTLLSQFTNDCGFVTSSQIPEGADLSTVFASVAYDPTTSRINFFGKGSNTVLAYLDAAPFIVDGMVENVTLDSSTNELVITFNTASGKSPIRVPLGSISGQGTVQSVKMNGGTPIQPVNGVIDLGTVITEHQSLSSYATKNEMSVSESNGVATIQVKENNSAEVYTKSKTDELLGTKANDNAVVKSVTINGTTPTLNNGNVNLGTIQSGEDGITPHIDPISGNWMLGTTDTTVHAQGPKGDKGDRGDLNITEGTTPTLTIVSDLNTDDDEVDNIKVLSAGMGKRIGDELYADREAVLDFANTELTMVYIDSGKFYTSNKYGGKFFNIARYKGWTLRIGNYKLTSGTNAGNWFYRFALLKNDAHASNTAPAYSDVSPYNDSVSVNSASDDDQWTELTIPDDVNYIYVYTHNSENTAPDNDFDPVVVLTNPNAQSRISALEVAVDAMSGELFKAKTTKLSLENTELAGVYINGTKWKTDSYYQGKIIDISQYKGRPFRIGNRKISSTDSENGNWFYRFAFLTSDSHTGGQRVPFSNYSPFTGQISVNSSDDADQWYEGIIPEDATHLYVYCYNSSSSILNHYFPPEIIVKLDVNRITELENKTEGLDGIGDDWRQIKSEGDYVVPITDCWRKQTIGTNGRTYSGSSALTTNCFPKSADISTAAASSSDCYDVSDLPDPTELELTFSQLSGDGYWGVAVCCYNAMLGFIERLGYYDTTESDTITVSLSSGTRYFKLLVEKYDSSHTSGINLDNYILPPGFLSYKKMLATRESLPTRVASLESKFSGIIEPAVRRFTLCSWNVGHFALGAASSTAITSETYDEMKAKWCQKLNEMSPDILLMCEYSTLFAKNPDVTAADAVFNQFAYSVIGTASGYMQTAQYANLPILNTEECVFEHYIQWRYYQVSDIKIGDITAKVVITHLDFTDSNSNSSVYRAEQIQRLLDDLDGYEHVIICGDFNVSSADEYNAFKTAGYTMANNGYLGVISTYPAGESPVSALDNIIVKGFAMNNIKIVNDATLTDHCAIMCDLTVL